MEMLAKGKNNSYKQEENKPERSAAICWRGNSMLGPHVASWRRAEAHGLKITYWEGAQIPPIRFRAGNSKPQKVEFGFYGNRKRWR